MDTCANKRVCVVDVSDEIPLLSSQDEATHSAG